MLVSFRVFFQVFLCLTMALSLQQAIFSDLVTSPIPKLVLYCPSDKCLANATIQRLIESYPSLLFINQTQFLGKRIDVPFLVSIGREHAIIMKESFEKYANYDSLPYSFELTESLVKNLRKKQFGQRLIFAAINASIPAHLEFYGLLLDSTKNQTNIGFLNIDSQFDLAISLETYRRHCPTINAFNPKDNELWLTFKKFQGNKTEDSIQLPILLKDLNEDGFQSIRIGWTGFYTRFLNLLYVYNNFHVMFNFIVGGISIIFIIFLLIFEKKILKAMQPNTNTSNKKLN